MISIVLQNTIKGIEQTRKLLIRVLNEGFLHIMVGNTLIKILSFFSSMLVARLLTKQEMGLISYVDNIFSYFNLIAGLGVSSSILRYCTIAKTQDEKMAYFSFSFKFGLGFQIVLCIIIFIIAHFANFPFLYTRELILTLLFMPLISFIYEYMLSFLRSEMKFKAYSGIALIFSSTMVITVFIFTAHLHLIGIVLARFTAYTVGIIVLATYLKKFFLSINVKKIFSYPLCKTKIKPYLSYSFANICSIAFSTMMPLNESFLINNILRNSVISANFKVAMAIPYNVLFVTNSIMVFAFPYFAKNQENKKWIWKNSIRLTLGLSIFFTFCGIIYCAFSKQIIYLIYGEKYLDISRLSSFLFLTYSINAGFRMIALNILIALGYAHFNALMSIFSLIAQVSIDTILISTLGIYGAVYGIFFVYIISGIISWTYLYKKTRNKPSGG